MLILYNPLRNSIQNSVSLKFGNSATAMIRTAVFTVLVSRYGLLEIENIPPACKNTLASAFSWLSLVLYLVFWSWGVSTLYSTEAVLSLLVEFICINVSLKKLQNSVLVLFMLKHKCHFNGDWVFLLTLFCSLSSLLIQALLLRLLL